MIELQFEERSGGTGFVWSLRRSCLVGKSGVAVQLIAVRRVARDAHLLHQCVGGWVDVDGEAAQTLSDKSRTVLFAIFALLQHQLFKCCHSGPT